MDKPKDKHADRPLVGMSLPSGYGVFAKNTLYHGVLYRAQCESWLGNLHRNPLEAEEEAWNHHYVSHGAMPRLRVRKDKYTDVLTGHSVTTIDVLLANGFGAAFRLRAERMRANADAALHHRLAHTTQHIADTFEEIAQRLEVRRVDE